MFVASIALSGGYQAVHGVIVPCPTVLRSEPFIGYILPNDYIYFYFPWRCEATGGVGCNWYYELHIWDDVNRWVEGKCITGGGKCGQYSYTEGTISGVSVRYPSGRYSATIDVYNGTCADKAHSRWLDSFSCTFVVQ